MKFEEVDFGHRQHGLRETRLPSRATQKAAGYDFFAKETFMLKPHQTKLIYTDVKCKLEDDEVLLIYPRSGNAIKHGIVLANGTGVIDTDYYSNESNDGNIIIALRFVPNDPNAAKKPKNLVIKQGERIAQGVVVKFQTEGEEVDSFRKGGLGSTGK